jgi:IclR family transcriptional regulator, KDG regulon repressor
MDTTILKGLTVLERLADSDQPRGVSELSREMSLSKSNVQRVLRTLVDLGYAQQDEATGRYAPTLRMWEFGYKALSRDRVKLAAGAYLRTLAERISETVFLCIRDGADIIYVDRVDSTDPTRVFCTVGMRLPALKTAAGRAVLAFQDDDVIAQGIEAMAAEGAKAADAKRLRDELAKVRTDGIAISIGDFRPGVNSAAAAVWGGNGKVVGSVSITGAEERLPPARLQALAPEISGTAVRISEALGYRLS